MKYLEELTPGSSFIYESNIYLLTKDFKSDGKKLCYSLVTGINRWLESNIIINEQQLYTLDSQNNIQSIKQL